MAIIQDLIREFRIELNQAEEELVITEKTVLTARQRIVSLKLKILQLEVLLPDKE